MAAFNWPSLQGGERVPHRAPGGVGTSRNWGGGVNPFEVLTQQPTTPRRAAAPDLCLKRSEDSKAHRMLQMLMYQGPMTARELARAEQLPNSGFVGALLKHHIQVGRVTMVDGTYTINRDYSPTAQASSAGLRQLIEWHPVDSRLPDADLTVLVALKDDAEDVWLGYLDGETWRNAEGFPIKVTHWAEIPLPPSRRLAC